MQPRQDSNPHQQCFITAYCLASKANALPVELRGYKISAEASNSIHPAAKAAEFLEHSLNSFSFRAVTKWNLPTCWFVFDRISVGKLNVQSIFSSLKFPNCSTLFEHNSIVLDVYQRNKHLFALAVFDFYRSYPGGASNLSKPLVDLMFSKIMNERLDRLPCDGKSDEEGE